MSTDIKNQKNGKSKHYYERKTSLEGYKMGASKKLRGLTWNQRRYVKEYIKAKGNGTLAVANSYPNVAPKNRNIISSHNLNRPAVKNAILQALDRVGLTDDYIANTLKRNIPEESIGKGATATTVNKTLEILLKMREPVRESKSTSLHMHLFQDLSNMNEQELIDKRTKTSDYFNKILNNKTKKQTKSKVIDVTTAS